MTKKQAEDYKIRRNNPIWDAEGEVFNKTKKLII